MPWEEQPGKKPSCSLGQKAFHIEPAQRPFSTTEMVTWTLPSVSAEDVPRETPPEPRSMPQHSHSLDELWLEKTQRRKLKQQAQVERKMHAGIAHEDGVQVSSSHPCVIRHLIAPFLCSCLHCLSFPLFPVL